MLKEFKEFAMRGNVVDLAVGIIIGGAFGKIVTSLVNDIIMPSIGILLGKLDFSGLVLTVGASSISYGLFIQSIIDFLIVAAAIFIVIQQMNRLRSKKQDTVAVESPTEIKLLAEIRDLLKK